MDRGSETDQAPLAASELQRRAIAGSVWTVLHLIVSLPLAFVANAVVARSLGVTNYGHLAFLTAAFSLAISLANFGFNTALIQRGSRAEAGGRRNEADELLRRNLGFQLIIEFPILVVVAAALTRGDPWWVVGALGTGVVLTCLLSGAALSITIENRTAGAAKMAMLGTLFVQGATVLAALTTGSASAIWATRTLVSASVAGLAFLLLDPARRATVLKPRPPLGLGKTFWRYAILSWASGMVALLVFSRSEIFLLKAFHQPEALGLFALAFGLSYQVTAPADALLHPLLPAVAGVLSAWPDRALRAFERSTRVSALVCGAIAASLAPALVFAIPLIYGSEFRSAAWFFFPLALVSAFQSVNNPVTAFVNARQRGGLILKANLAALAVDIGIAVALIPDFGAWGAVAANGAGQLVTLGWLAIAEPLASSQGFERLLKLYRPFLVGVLASTVALGAGAALQSLSALLATFVAGFLGFGLYITLIRLFRSGLTTQDRDVLIDAMSMRVRPHIARLLRPITTPNPP
jgi:O-antigen/teichoic acid export membrane protein